MRIAIALGLALISSVALAQSDGEVIACHRDAIRWCKHSLDSQPSLRPTLVRGCLAAHKADLSPRCRAVLSNHGM